MDTNLDFDIIGNMVKRVFAFDDVTLGSSQQTFLVRYRGRLIAPDSAQAYDQLADSLKPLGLTPLFRVENGQQVILIEKSAPSPKPAKPVINLILAILTLISMVTSGAIFALESLPQNPFEAILLILKTGWPFAVSLMVILAVHEFGHYLAARYHKIRVSLPFFIPLPFTQLGTLGAVIVNGERDKNKRVAMDMAVAGPIAGFVASVVVIFIGISMSNLDRIPAVMTDGNMYQVEGNSILYLLVKFLRFGQLLPQPFSYGDVSPVLYWLKYFFTGQPLPFGGLDVIIHPVAFAGWVGLLLTFFNLIPAGQLDGGHIFYLLFGKNKAQKILPVIILLLAGMGFLWSGWWLWAGLIFFLSRVNPEPLDQITELDRPRKLMGWIVLVIFLLTITPIPFTIMGA